MKNPDYEKQSGPQLVNVGFFSCPAVPEVKPVRIAEGDELVEILTGGKVRFEWEGEERVFCRGTVFCHRGGDYTVCRTFADAPYSCIVFCFRTGGAEHGVPRVSIWNTPEEAVFFAEECRQAFHSGSADLAALADYAWATIRWKARAGGQNHPPECPAFLLKLAGYIDAHLSSELTPEVLAQAVKLSRPYLFALFQRYFQNSPCRYIAERRIIRAKVLLTADNTPIKEIAVNCGFPQLEVFYRQFRKQTGMTPAAYRRKFTVRP